MYAYVQICIIYSTDVCVCASVWILSVPPVSIKYIIESIEHDQHQPHQPQHHRLNWRACRSLASQSDRLWGLWKMSSLVEVGLTLDEKK